MYLPVPEDLLTVHVNGGRMAGVIEEEEGEA